MPFICLAILLPYYVRQIGLLEASAHSMILMIALFVKPKQLAKDVPQFVVLSQ